jgi:hypothetical protein
LQPSLFTRLAAVEAELLAMRDLLADLKVNQDELRQDRDEWRWRAERLLADLHRGAWWRWRGRAAAALDAVATSLWKLLADAENKLAEMRANRDERRHGRVSWFRRDRPRVMDRRIRWRLIVGRVNWLRRARKAAEGVSWAAHSSSPASSSRVAR